MPKSPKTRERVSLRIRGRPAVDEFVVNTEHFGSSKPAGADESGLKSRIYYDISVEGIDRGTATLTIKHPKITGKHSVMHWNGSKWIGHPEAVAKPNVIQAEFKVSDLHGTPIVIGT